MCQFAGIWHGSCIPKLGAARSCSSRAGNSAQRRGFVRQVVQNLNPFEECGLTVVVLISADKSYLEKKKNHIQKKWPLACTASLCDCAFPIDFSVCSCTAHTFYCSCQKLSPEYQYLIFNICCSFPQ